MTMEDAMIRSTVAEAVERFAAYVGALPHAASPTPSSSSSSSFSAPTGCDILISRIHVKARWLIRMLAWVRATLYDAEDMDITEESVRHWLRQLQDAADAAEDVLDEFSHEAMRLGFVGDEADAPSASPPEARPPKRTVGRQEELEKIKQFLLSSDAEEEESSDMDDDHVSVTVIVGMGGLGKTTLAQLAYNDPQVNQHFQLKAWVCVSEDFDVIRLTKAMLQSLNVEASGLSELDPLQKKLVQKLEGKQRFLLVLDDVWEAKNLNQSSWNLLTAPFRYVSADTKIIMTTRSSKVPDVAPRTWTRDLDFLSNEGRDPNLCQNLVTIGQDDVKWNKIRETVTGEIASRFVEMEEVSAFLRDVEKRIEEIASRFVEMEKPEQALQHEHSKEQMDAESINAIRTTSSVMEEPAHIVGRDEELEKIKQFLLSSDAEEEESSDMDDDHVSVMAIVGMGGLGKTTLAQLAYNDPQVNQHFQLKAWVCVSEDFDVIRLTKAMLQSLNVEASGLSELDPLHKKLVQKLEGKLQRVLLVLDDVWEAENLNPSSWNLLTAPFRYVSADTKIIMTTRSKKVSDVAPRTWTYDLGFLSEEDTLELFMQHAFEGRDPNLCQNLVAIGKEIARKCGGVPLAAKTFGGLLCTKDDEEWNKILDSEVWNATINKEDSIISILRLSYLHLSAPLKRCFRYCSLFPKDWVFDRDRMIHMWMAQGYIKANRKKLMEDIGQGYIDNLLSRSFFQKDPWLLEGFQMHDLMHDLARCVSGDECYSMEGDKSCSMIPSHVRHLSVSLTRDSHRTINMWSRNNISDPKSLRSFILLDDDSRYSFTDDHSLMMTRMEHLRVLSLGGVYHSCLPESIARLKHLRFLHLSLEALPESVGSMYHIQTLYLGGARSILPKNISNLHNLRHLILNSRRGDCVRYPVGMGKLTDLQTVPDFFVSPNHSSSGKLGELKDMNNIRGEFAIKGLENLADVNEAKKACLHKKRNIRSLHLRWDPRAASSSIDGDVLESLKPSVKLASLEISGFKGPSYPLWLGDRSFTRLVSIRLEHCQNCTFLPPLGQLPSLKSLYIYKARAVEYIGSDFFSGGFPQLEELTLHDMDNWKSWCGAQEGDCPKLKKLYIEGCDNLQSLSLNNLAAVEDMYISIFSTSEVLCMPGNSLELSHLQRAKTIKIKKKSQELHIEAHLSPTAPSEDEPQLQLEDVGQREAEYMLGMCSHICRLTVKSCSNLTFLPLVNYSALKYVEISYCRQLRITSVSPQLWQLPSLQKIHVHEIEGAVKIKVVRESSVELTNVDQLVAFALLKEFSHMIRHLVITNCAKLTSLPWTDLTALEYLRIGACPLFQLLDAKQLPSTLQVLCIYGNPYETEQCSRHPHFQRLKQVHQCSNKKGGERNLYLVFRNVHDASAASKFCSVDFTYINHLEVEWDCCTNDRSNVADAITQEVLLNLGSLCISSKRLVIRGYIGSGFAGWYADFSSKTLRSDVFHSRLSHVSLLQCSKCDDLAPLSRLPFLEELYVEGASSLQSVVLDCLFPCDDMSEGASSLESDMPDCLFPCDDMSEWERPASRLPFLEELYVEGASSLESVALDCLFPCDDMSEGKHQATHTSIAFPRLQKLEFRDMPVWKEWLGTKEGDFPFLGKLVLNQCPRLRALPHLPPGLKELILEGCEELRSLSSSSQGLKSLKSLRMLSVTNCPNMDFTATEGPPPGLERLSLTGCPLLLEWCEGHPRMLASLSYLWVDGVRVSPPQKNK